MKNMFGLTCGITPTEGARLYLELSRITNGNAFYYWDGRNDNVRLDKESELITLSPSYATWLVNQKDCFDLFHRMVEAGGPPLPTFEELLALERNSLRNDDLDYIPVRWSSVVADEIVRCIAQSDGDSATTRVLDLIGMAQISQEHPSETSRFTYIFCDSALSRTLYYWLRTSPPNPTQARIISSALERLDSPEIVELRTLENVVSHPAKALDFGYQR